MEDIITIIATQFKNELTKENLQKKLNSYMLLEKILFIRVIPTFIKDFALKFFVWQGKKGQTSVLSNLGIIKLPQEFEQYISSFSAIASTDDQQLTVCSFKNNLVLCFSSHFINKDIERSFLKEIQKELDNKIHIISNIGSDA